MRKTTGIFFVLIILSLFGSGLCKAEYSNKDNIIMLNDEKIVYNKDLTKLVKKLLPAVISIKTTSVLESNLTKYNEDYYFYNSTTAVNSIGSGFIISEDGYILTNTHVIDNSDGIYVIYAGKEYRAELIGSDYVSDVAVLKIRYDGKLPYFELKKPVAIDIGENILVIGNPYGLGVSVSYGIVSALNRGIKETDYNNLIQTDAAINRGNSGGPMFNLNGDIIGITSMIFSENGNNMGVGFAIPIADVLEIVEKLKTYGYVQRGWLGIKTVDADANIMNILKTKREEGILVVDVLKNSPADRAGVLYADVIVSYNNRKLKNSDELNFLIKESAIDSDANMLILRNGDFVKIKARIKESPSKFDAEIENIKINSIDVFGMYLTAIDNNLIEKFELYSKLKGLLVLDVKNNGWAKNNAIDKGDIILSANQKQVKTKDDLMKIVQETKTREIKDILLIVRKMKNKKNVLLRLNLSFSGY